MQHVKNSGIGFFLKELIQKKENYLLQLEETEKALYQELLLHPKVKKRFNLDPIGKAQFDEDNFLYLLTLMKITTLES